MTSTNKDNAQSWDTCILVPTYTFVIMQCKDVGSDPVCLRDALSMGTLVWKVFQILSCTYTGTCPGKDQSSAQTKLL